MSEVEKTSGISDEEMDELQEFTDAFVANVVKHANEFQADVKDRHMALFYSLAHCTAGVLFGLKQEMQSLMVSDEREEGRDTWPGGIG